MTPEELQKKYDHLVDIVARMRAKQVHYEKYKIGDDRRRMKALERQVDGIIGEEMKRKRSNQKELY